MRSLLILFISGATILSTGCTLCSTPYDCHYGAYGGRNPRIDRVHGRVGSAFHDAGSPPEVYAESYPASDPIIIEGEMINDPIATEDQFYEGIVDGIADEYSDANIISDTNIDMGAPGEIVDTPISGDTEIGDLILSPSDAPPAPDMSTPGALSNPFSTETPVPPYENNEDSIPGVVYPEEAYPSETYPNEDIESPDATYSPDADIPYTEGSFLGLPLDGQSVIEVLPVVN